MHACHNHAVCVSDAMAQAEQACVQGEVRLTPARRKILGLLWENHQPMKAYDLLARLKQDIPSAQPPTVYRALDFLLEQGLIHKIERLNAYMGCQHRQEKNLCSFLICTKCQLTQEVHQPLISQLLQHHLREKSFTPARVVLEVEGLCQACSA